MRRSRGFTQPNRERRNLAKYVTVKLPCHHIYQLRLSVFDLRGEGDIDCPRCCTNDIDMMFPEPDEAE